MHFLPSFLPATDPAHKERVIYRELDYRVQLLGAFLKQIIQLQRGSAKSDVTITGDLVVFEIVH